MKDILLSVRPKWCEKICHEIGKDENGKPIYEKVIEVRKSKPSEVPFRAFIYCTKGKSTNVLLKDKNNRFVFGDYRNACTCDADGNVEFENVQGKVIGEFICDNVDEIILNYNFEKDGHKLIDGICLTENELERYAQGRKTIYGWHISDLKIYDKPRELSEFRKPCLYGDMPCVVCEDYSVYSGECQNIVTRPPQSWCYVEEEK